MSPLPLDEDLKYTTIAQLVQPPQIAPRRKPDDPENTQKRRDPFQFGSRFLEEGDDVFSHNAWDHVETDPEYREFAEHQYARQRETPVSEFDRLRFNTDPAKWWNMFYKNNTDKFFKNRKWLQQEFPALSDAMRPDAGPKVILEVGAGAGNTAFPIITNNENEHLRVHACDFSKTAVDVMRNSEHYDPKHMTADVWDVAAEGEDSLPPGLSEGSVDVVVLIFIFSALAPDQWERAMSNVYRVLKPGGLVLFRDYGRGDLAQVRFKKGRWMADNFYVRGDGTRVYFFEKDELAHIWGKYSPETGLPKQENTMDSTAVTTHEQPTDEKPTDSVESGFEILNLAEDRRLVVNRQRKLKMYRCWMQACFRKKEQKREPSENPAASTNDADQTQKS